MGANAQTTVPSFVASQVLTADQQNQSARTGVPVFATTVTRDAAFGGTGEKTLAEGQLCYVEGTGLQTYNGSSWVTWGAAPTSGFTVVKAETSFSASASVTADNVFTSSYSNYRIVFKYQTSTTGGIYARLRASGSSATGTNYNWQRILGNGGTITGAQNAGISYWELGNATNGAYNSLIIIDLISPQLAEPTLFSNVNPYHNGSYATPLLFTSGGNHSLSTAYDGIELYPATGTTTGAYTIYGYGKS